MSLGAKEVPDVTWEYWSIVEMMDSTPGLYGMDSMRSKCHVRLCKHYGLEKEETRIVTDHMDKCKDGLDLHWALLKLKGVNS
jgi:hypothetical protein